LAYIFIESAVLGKAPCILSLFPSAGKVTKRAAAADKKLKINEPMPERKELAPQESVLKQLFFDSRLEVTSSPSIDLLNAFSQKRGHAVHG
jgi:hypothetical protein